MATRGSTGRRNRNGEEENQHQTEGTNDTPTNETPNEALIRELREAIDATRSVPPPVGVQRLTATLVSIANHFNCETEAVYEGRPLLTAAQSLVRITPEAITAEPEQTRIAIGSLSKAILQNLANTRLGGGEGRKATINLLRDEIEDSQATPALFPSSTNTSDQRAKEAVKKMAQGTFNRSDKTTLMEVSDAMRVINSQYLEGFSQQERSLFWATTILTTDLSDSHSDVKLAKAQLKLMNEEEWRALNFSEWWTSQWNPESRAARLREAIAAIERPNDFRTPAHGETWEGRLAEIDTMLSEVGPLEAVRRHLTPGEQSIVTSIESIVTRLMKSWKVKETQGDEAIARFMDLINKKGGARTVERYQANVLITTMKESGVNDILTNIARIFRVEAAERQGAQGKRVAKLETENEAPLDEYHQEGTFWEDEDIEVEMEALAARVGATLTDWACHYCGEKGHALRKCDACQRVIEDQARSLKETWEKGAKNKEPKALASFLAAIAAKLDVPLAQSYARRLPPRTTFRGRAERNR